MSKVFTLYGAEMSLYTGKVRAYLTYKKIPFREVFSSMKVYKSIIVPKTGVRFIPVLETPEGEFIQDTVQIIDYLESRFDESVITPNTPKQQLVSEIFQLWADEWLVIPAMHYRWNKNNFPFIYEEFGRVVTPSMPAFVRRFVGKKVAARFKGFVPLLGITPKSIPAIEKWYEKHVLVELDRHFAIHDYLLGNRPCIGDFGLIGPLYAHLYRDPAPGAIMRVKAPNVVKWIERLNSAPIENRSCLENRSRLENNSWLENDQIPETLNVLLARIFSEFWPVMLSSVEKIQTWIAQNPKNEKIPRTIGSHDFTMGKMTEARAVMTFHQWKLQRVLDVYFGFNPDDKSSVDGFLKSTFGLKVEPINIAKRLQRKNNKLVVE